MDLGQLRRTSRSGRCPTTDRLLVHDAMAVMSTVVDAVTPGQVNHLAAQLPDE
jgi:hypothetical protein